MIHSNPLFILIGVVAMAATAIARSAPTPPVTDAEVISSILSFDPLDNRLSSANGTQVTVPSNLEASGFLIDGQPLQGWRAEDILAPGVSLEILFRMPRGQELSSLVIQPRLGELGSSTPVLMELQVSRESSPGEFLSLGHFRLGPGRAWHRVSFSPRTTRDVKLVIHSVSAPLPVGIGEVAAFSPGFNAAPRYSFAPQTDPSQSLPSQPDRPVSPPAITRQRQPAPPPMPPSEIRGIPEVVNTGLLRIDRKMIPLYGVQGEYEPYASQLAGFIRDREVYCKKRGKNTYSCTVEGRNLSLVVLGNGAGRAQEGADADLKASESEARDKGAGIWQ